MFVIFHKDTTKFARIMRNGYWQDAKYATRSAAKAGKTRLVKAGTIKDEDYRILPYDEFLKIEKGEIVHNLMSGQPVIQSVNTPLSCDVSSETYWSL